VLRGRWRAHWRRYNGAVKVCDVLIAGAGPTGLVLALWLTRSGARVRIIDKAAEPGTTSRALGVQARTLEFYRQLGIAEQVVERGLKFAAANLWVKGRQVGHVRFGDMGVGLSRYPYMLIFPQDEHERFLIDRLTELDVRVERPTELLGFEDRDEGIVARIKLADGSEETCTARYLAGCDGARSIVREQLGTGFPGGTYAHMFYVADAEATGPVMNHELHVALDDAGFLAVFPMKGEGRARFIGTVKDSAATATRALEWSDVSTQVIARLGVKFERINWFSTYHVHHRVAAHFRVGRAFLLGDAAHIHSPVGAQGMNTGLGDAINLAWKLAAVLQNCASPQMLDTYEPERIAFAKRLVASTDRAFQLVTSDGPIARWVRVHVVPRVMPALFKLASMRRLMFRTISQTAINYRPSALSSGADGALQAGDRLPWVTLAAGTANSDNFTPLSSLDWQVHVYGAPGATLVDLCKARGIALHAFEWRDEMRGAGLAQDAAYLVRPDGYVGCADRVASGDALARSLDTWGVRPRLAR
jgi:2-polyprenyl-6-methoxyphenol hydroxylase-like FAD-dependent oxidoreductase